MNKKILRIATRKSPLALKQADYIKQLINQRFPSICIEVVGISTTGDRFLHLPLNKIGGKALFVKELEKSLLAKETDIAVHSAKDLPSNIPEELMIAVFSDRADPRDAFISKKYNNLLSLPQGARVGTSSLRRQAQLKALRSDLNFFNLRGNINSRLKKLEEDEFDAIILAAAGLERLHKIHHIRNYLTIEQCLPAVGQGILAIECRRNDREILQLIEHLEDQNSRICITAERAMNKYLGGNCQVPVAGYAKLDNSSVLLKGLVASVDGRQIIRAYKTGPTTMAEDIGVNLAKDLLQQGADKILHELN